MMPAAPHLALLLAKATLLLIVALGAAATLRRSTAGARHLVWLATLGGLLALPLLARVAPLDVPVLAPATATDGRRTTDDGGAAVQPSTPPGAEVSAASSAPTPSSVFRRPSVPPPSPLALAAALWSAVALALLAWLALGARAVRRIVREGVPLDGDGWTTPLFEVADRLGLDDAPRLVASERVEMAFACGVLRPTIVLPAAARDWTDERRRAVLFHELAHVRRRDLLGHTLGRLACALYWFHPLVWTAARRLRAESERACDDLVLACGARPTDYAQHLLDMVTSVRAHGAPAVALPMARPREFEGRMLAILDPSVRRAAPGRLERAGILGALGVLALAVSAATPVPRDASPVLQQPAPRPSRAAGAAVPGDTAAGRAGPGAGAETRTETRTEMRTETATRMERWTEPRTRERPDERVRDPRPARERWDAAALAPQDTARVALFLGLLRGDRDAAVRRTAAWALQRARGRADVTRALAAALRGDADAEVRETSAWALAGTGDAEALASLAFALRNDREEEVRTTAAWALGSSHVAETGALAAAAGDPSAEVRQAAIWALGTRRPSAAPAQLVAALSDRDEEVRVVAGWALGQIADPATREALTTAFLKGADGESREATLWALLRLGALPRSVVDAALASRDGDLRARAVAMLAGADHGPWPWPWPWPWPRPQP